MPLTARPRFAPGDTIPSAWANILDDNFSLLDGRTGGDPGGVGKIPVSSGTLGAAWLALGAANLPLVSNGTTLGYAQLVAAAYADLSVTNAKLATDSVDNRVLAATAALDNLGFTPPNADTPIITTFAAALVANGSGFFEVNGAADGPTGSGTWYLLHIGEGNSPTTYAWQITCEINDQNAVYMRLVIGGTPGTWRKVWHAGNDGAGSLLDADNLDGVTWKRGKTGKFSGTQALTTSFADAAGASFSADRDGQWFVIVQSEHVMAIGDSHPSVQIVAGGTPQEEGVGTAVSGSTSNAVAIAHCYVDVSGATTIKAQVKKNANVNTSNCLYVKISGHWVAP